MSNRLAVRILIIAVVAFAVFAVYSVVKFRHEQNRYRCVRNLIEIEGVKEQFAIEHQGQAPTDFASLIPGYIDREPVCPGGGAYTLGDMQTAVVCSRKGHRDDSADLP